MTSSSEAFTQGSVSSSLGNVLKSNHDSWRTASILRILLGFRPRQTLNFQFKKFEKRMRIEGGIAIVVNDVYTSGTVPPLRNVALWDVATSTHLPPPISSPSSSGTTGTSGTVDATPMAVSEGTVDATPMAVSEGTGTRSSSIPPTDQSTMEFATVTTPDEEEMSTGGGKTEDVNELDVIVAASKNWDLKNPATKENVPTPDGETLKRWGFYRIKSMGGLDDYRNEQYHKLMKELESRFELTAEHNQEMNMSKWKYWNRPKIEIGTELQKNLFHVRICSESLPEQVWVTAKPDLYPLVISYSENGKTGGSYLMVQYFRNYIMRPVAPPCTVSTETERRIARPSLCGLSNVSSLSMAPQDSPPQATTPTLGKNNQDQIKFQKNLARFQKIVGTILLFECTDGLQTAKSKFDVPL
ncbi:unnamed protein product [Nesidiocoris tenuis]|uniref:Uncharacterized protein n=1 Tax=Nesidiocoris tenuis TaxID=355587 RepID=A0A6H5GH38_9HEMI|nr:unnamed protein product [Nesidiocoris tenuis]